MKVENFKVLFFKAVALGSHRWIEVSVAEWIYTLPPLPSAAHPIVYN